MLCIRLMNLLATRLVAGALVLFLSGHAAAADLPIPDFTQGGTVPAEAKTDWNLGASGARGWMYSARMSTSKARQVFIRSVEPGSPAQGILDVGDVVLGVDGKLFALDPRTEIGRALTLAESNAGRGNLRLIRWRAGKTEEVTIKLPVLGNYSNTAPYNCPKSKLIIEQGCEALARKMEDPKYTRTNPIVRSLNGLALLASGQDRYLPLIQREAQWAAGFESTVWKSWFYGYVMIYLSEYVIKTGDKSVLPGLERLALETARGQSIVGSWGHAFALSNGRLGGYGMMNQPGIILTIGLVLAREAGVGHVDLELAIDRSVLMLRFYVGKGSVPYGDHDPWIQNHDDNGKNSAAAVLFNLLGDAEAAEYFSRMSVACYGVERDTGHTGNFWNILWAMPAIALSGPHASGAWMQESGASYFDAARTWQRGFVHQGPPDLDRDSYYGSWDPTAGYLLAYAMPLKQIRLTGKGATRIPQLTAAQAGALIEDGRGWANDDRNSYYDAMTTEQLIEKLGSWSPVVRDRAAVAIGRRKANVVSQLIEMLKAKDLYTRYGACVALQYSRVDRTPAVQPLIDTMQADDLWLRILAIKALAKIGKPAKVAVPVMLEHLAHADPLKDPRGMEQRYICFALFQKGGLINASIDGIDQARLAQAIRVGLENEDGKARSAVAAIYSKLTLEQIRPLLPAIYKAVIEPSPSGIMFASGVRTEGLRILAQHHVAEGIDAGVYLLEFQNFWDSKDRTPLILKSIVSYGQDAARVIPDLERIAELYLQQDLKKREPARNHIDQMIQKAIEEIQASTQRSELIHILNDAGHIQKPGRVGDAPAYIDN